MDTFLNNLFARKALISHLTDQIFSQSSGWIELVCVLALMSLTFWLSHLISLKYFTKPTQNFPLLRHIGKRILWPVLIVVSSIIILIICNFMGYPALWLHLLILAARWMIVIRICAAIVHAALPKNRFTNWLERAVSSTLWVGFLLWLSELDDKIIDFFKNIQFTVGSSKLNLYTIITGLLWVCVLMIFAMWLARFISNRLEKSSLDANLSMILSKIIKTAMMILSVLIALPLVGIDLTVLSVFGGALGVGIGFGLQKVASNYISGFIILGDRSIRINDRLTVNNFTGYVTKITSRFVVLRNANGTDALIPNETFITSMVVNESYTSKSLQQFFMVQIAYHSDLLKALEILKNAAAAQSRVEQEPAPAAIVTDFADNGINLRLNYWVKDPENGFGGLQSAIMLDIWKQFNQHNIEFPFPQREVRILNETPNPSQADIITANTAKNETAAALTTGDHRGEG